MEQNEIDELVRQNAGMREQLKLVGATLHSANTHNRMLQEAAVRTENAWREREAALLETMVGLRVRGSLLKQRTRRMTETMKTCRRELNSLLEGRLYPDQNLAHLIGRIDEILEAHQ